MQSQQRKQNNLYKNKPSAVFQTYVYLLNQRREEKQRRNIFQFIRNIFTKTRAEKLIEEHERLMLKNKIYTPEQLKELRARYA